MDSEPRFSWATKTKRKPNENERKRLSHLSYSGIDGDIDGENTKSRCPPFSMAQLSRSASGSKVARFNNEARRTRRELSR